MSKVPWNDITLMFARMAYCVGSVIAPTASSLKESDFKRIYYLIFYNYCNFSIRYFYIVVGDTVYENRCCYWNFERTLSWTVFIHSKAKYTEVVEWKNFTTKNYRVAYDVKSNLWMAFKYFIPGDVRTSHEGREIFLMQQRIKNISRHSPTRWKLTFHITKHETHSFKTTMYTAVTKWKNFWGKSRRPWKNIWKFHVRDCCILGFIRYFHYRQFDCQSAVFLKEQKVHKMCTKMENLCTFCVLLCIFVHF